MSPEKINLPLTESTLLAQLQRPYVKGFLQLFFRKKA